MKITILVLFAMCLCALSSFAQNTYTIKGAATDSASMTNLTATVTVMNAKDSVLVTYAHAGNGGIFSINGLSAGKYLLLVTYPDYADYVEAFTLDPLNKDHDFGSINMQLKSSILKEVIIKGDATAIELHGDTTVFNAKAYIVQPNAKVEELLKQFPGIEINSKGKIKANGEEVKKVLVDGEEFFGDDPTLVTRNLRADMVDKVELFDKKSDQATFTGIDDGQKTKTLNVILKEDKKKGVFGKVSAGGGTDKYYEGQGIYNKFTATAKLSVYGTAANDGTTGLGSADNSKIGATSGLAMLGDDGGYIISGGSYDQLDNSTYSGTGLPIARNTGAHYDGKWDKGLQSINSNYRLGSLGVNTETTNLSQQSLPGAIITNDRTSNGHTYFFRQKADGVYTYAPNIGTSLRVSVDGAIRNNESQNSSVNLSSSSINGGDDELKNMNTSNSNSKGQDKTVDASILFSKRLKKPRRTFSWNLSGTYNERESKNYIFQDFYTPSDSTHAVTDQFKPSNSSTAVISSNITYTEPITKRLSAVISYGTDINNSSSDLESYNKSISGNYDLLDADYSNNYKFNQFINKAGLNFSYTNGSKVNLTFGTKVSDVNFKQVDVNSGDVFKRDFTNWAPAARLTYSITPTQTFNVSYSGNNYQPSISQIQPVKNNTDVANIYIGNADLKASFQQNINFRYNQYQQVSNSGLGVSGSYSFANNVIVNKQTIDANNISTIQYVNLNDKTFYNYRFSMNKDTRSLMFGGSHFYFTGGINGNVNYNYVNGELDKNSSQNYSLNVRLNRAKKNKHTINISVSPTYSFNKDMLQPSFNYHTPGFTTTDDVTIFITKKLQLYTDIDYQYYAKTRSLPARNYTVWNGALSETFLKDDNLKVSLSGNNLLNQDYNRTSQNGSTISQYTTNSIKRYFMLSVSWDFTKFGKTADKK